MKKALLFFSCLLCGAGWSQTFTIRDSSSHEPIPDVSITSGNFRTTSNALGRFSLPATADGTLALYHPGYKPITVNSPSELSADLKMVQSPLQLSEVVLSAARTSEDQSGVPYTIQLTDKDRIAFMNQPTSADVLQSTGQVFVQKSQLGGGSPVLRGFEANRVLIMVDGIRMNNAIYRAGHLQDVISLDPNMLDRLEVLYGPNSTTYGSDALGGVMHFYTRKPSFSGNEQLKVNGGFFLRTSNASLEQTPHLDLNLGWKNFASLTNITYSDFGDLRSGHTRLQSTPASWNRNYYAGRINDRDTMLSNSKPEIQVGSSYTQLDIMQRFLMKSGKYFVQGLNLQMSTTSDVPRYDRLTEYSGSKLRFAEWAYGPQQRTLAAYEAEWTRPTTMSDRMQLVVANQKVSQDRISRNFGNNSRKTQMEDVTVNSVNLDLLKKLAEQHELRYGLEIQTNVVRSTAKRTNILDGTETPADTRYAPGGNKMDLAGVYVSHKWEKSRGFVLTDGLRFSATRLESKFNDTTFFKFPFTVAKQQHSALTGNLGLTWREQDNYKFSLLFSTGFRSPNVDDMAKVFETNNNTLIVPNEKIKPEYASNFEVNFNKVLGGKFRLDFAAYYTLLENALVLDNYLYNGKDSVMVSGKKLKVQAMQNKDRAYIYGLSSGFEYYLNQSVGIKGNISYTYGRYENVKAGTIIPLDHIPPVFGQFSTFMKSKDLDAEFFVRFNGAKRSSEYSPSGEDNAQYSADPAKGYMPAWFTLNLRTQLRLNKRVSISAACENITDLKYRVFASGINAPGRNFILTLRTKF